jgi:hypothetical protein
MMAKANPEPGSGADDWPGQFELHEAGHAVAAVVLCFDPQSLTIERFGDFAASLGSCSRSDEDDGWIGSMVSGASAVTPQDPDHDRRHRSAVVAVAGPEARSRRYPKAGAWVVYEADDRARALSLLGRARTKGQVVADPENADDSALLAGVVAEARELLEQYRDPLEEMTRSLVAMGRPARMNRDQILAIVGPYLRECGGGPTSG